MQASSPSIEEVDVVVVGAGMAGLMAAMAAASEKTRVLIIEPSNVLGGQGTVGGVAGFCGDTNRVNRIFRELIDCMAAHDFIGPYNPNDDRRPYELEWCAYFLQEMVLERGIEVLLHSRVIDAAADQNGFSGRFVRHDSLVPHLEHLRSPQIVQMDHADNPLAFIYYHQRSYRPILHEIKGTGRQRVGQDGHGLTRHALTCCPGENPLLHLLQQPAEITIRDDSRQTVFALDHAGDAQPLPRHLINHCIHRSLRRYFGNLISAVH